VEYQFAWLVGFPFATLSGPPTLAAEAMAGCTSPKAKASAATRKSQTPTEPLLPDFLDVRHVMALLYDGVRGARIREITQLNIQYIYR